MIRQSAPVSLFRFLLSALLIGLVALGSASAVFAQTAVTFDSTTPAANRLIDTGSTQYEGAAITVSGITVTINGTHSFASLTVQNGGVVTHAPGLVGGMNLTISGNVTVTAGSSIQANYAGYPGNQGPGRGAANTTNSGGGASYGGSGARSVIASGIVYGDLRHPIDLGSGGGNDFDTNYFGGAGGGAIRLTVNGTLQIDGNIETNGQSVTRGGGGSGGSIYLTVGFLSGQGSIRASGGYSSSYYAASGGGGGGGRIAIYYQTNNFNGKIVAGGNNSDNYSRAAAGTIFLKQTSQANGDLIIQNDNGTNGAGTVIPYPDTFDNVSVVNRGVLSPDYLGTLELTVITKCFIDSVSSISATLRGYPAGQGYGAGKPDITTSNGGGGGSFGGEGTFSSSPAGFIYGDIRNPIGAKDGTHLGSGGGNDFNSTYIGGSGGGAIRLAVNGILQVDGTLESNGQSATRAGAGSGGSVLLNVGTLNGVGSITARGGYSSSYYGASGGAGGGGRIAIYYQTNNFPLNQISAAGGGSSNYGTAAAGTVFLKSSLQANGDLSIQNDGANGIPTILIGPNIFDNVHIWREGTLGPPYSQILNLTVVGNCIVDSYIRADGRGNGPGFGQGAGSNAASGWGGGGGGHGGAGGNTGGGGIGGGTYGLSSLPIDFTNPDITTNFGSGGGIGAAGIYSGTAGGGAIYLAVTGILSVNGQISASGISLTGGGAGAGGSLLIRTGMLTGTGSVTAYGGNSSGYYSIPAGGGGGGGRIAIYYQQNAFTGIISAAGGGGYNNGAAGTVFTQQTTASNLTLSLAVSPTSLGGGQSAVGSVTLSGSAPVGGISVSLTSGNINAATVPTSVSIAEGQTSGNFPISAASVTAAQTALITAQLWDRASSQIVTVQPWLGSLRLNPSSVTGGQTATGTLTLNLPAPGNGLTVSLTSSDPALTFPNGSTITLAQGTTTQNFTVKVGSVAAAKSATITASYLAESRTASVYLNPAGVQAQSIVAAPASVLGGVSTFGVVTLNGSAPSGGSLVALSCSDATVATVPAFVMVPAGQTSASFAIKTFPTTSLKTVLLNATLGVTQIGTLTVRLPGVASLTLVPAAIIGGSTSVGVVTLDGISTVPITITLSSNNGGAIPQNSIVIAPGQTGGTFTIATSVVTSATTALLTARANGTAKSQSLALYPVGTKLAIAVLSGVVTLEGCVNPAQQITFVLRPADGTANQTLTTTLGSDGSFSFSAILTQKYNVWIKGAKWLAKVVAVDASGGGASGITVTLPAADANNDNFCDATDFGVLVSAYNTDSAIVGSGYDPAADFNCDGTVDATDFGLLVGNYNTEGDR